MSLDNKKIKSKGETLSLLFSIALIFLIAIVFLQISFEFLIILIVLQLFYVIISQRQLVGNALRINEKQFSDINNIITENAEELKIKIPKVFIVQDPYLNTYTIGFRSPYSIILTSSLVESLSRDELDFVIGHEMGHIKFGHARTLSFISPIGKDTPFLSWFYGDWQRRAEYTADKVGFVLTNKIRPAINAMLKMTVGGKLSNLVDIDEIIEQIQEGQSGVITKAGETLLTHPYTTNRIKALVMFNSFGE